METLKVNIFGGQDVGKTTIAMHTAAELRWLGLRTALNYGPNCIPCNIAAVEINIFWRDPNTLTPYEAAGMCEDTLTFLIRRPKDYVSPSGHWMPEETLVAQDECLENTLRSGQVRYKSLPGMRTSVQYLIKKICDRVGYGK